MKKQLAFFSTQKSDEEIFKIFILNLKNNYKIFFFKYQKYLNIINDKKNKNSKKNYILKKFDKIIKKSELIITGSSKKNFEKNIWQLSKKLKIKSLTIVDSWVNFKFRFDKYFYPDHIILPNKKFDRKVICILKKNSKIYYLGNPFLEKFSKIKFKNNNKKILFLSSRQKNLLDFNLIKTLSIRYNKYEILIKLHPKDKDRNWVKYLKSAKLKNTKITNVSLEILFNKVGYVFGVYTVGLLASIIAGKKTFAYIDNKKQNDYLIDLIKKYGNCVNNELTGKKNLTEFKVKKFKENAIYKNSKIKILKIINDISHTN